MSAVRDEHSADDCSPAALLIASLSADEGRTKSGHLRPNWTKVRDLQAKLEAEQRENEVLRARVWKAFLLGAFVGFVLCIPVLAKVMA